MTRENFIEQLKAEFAPLDPFIPRAVHIAIPAHDRRAHIETMLALHYCVMELKDVGITCEISRHFAGGICESRTNALHAFMTSKLAPESFLFIDTDIKFSWDAFRRIIFNPYPVALNPYPLKRLDLDRVEALIKAGERDWRFKALHYPVNRTKESREGGRDILQPGGFVEIESGATGFMRVQREVFGKMRIDNPALQYEVDDGSVRHALFSFGLEYDEQRAKKIQKSEDLTFCTLARKSGFLIFADIREPITHMGDMEFEGFFGSHYGNQRDEPDAQIYDPKKGGVK